MRFTSWIVECTRRVEVTSGEVVSQVSQVDDFALSKVVRIYSGQRKAAAEPQAHSLACDEANVRSMRRDSDRLSVDERSTGVEELTKSETSYLIRKMSSYRILRATILIENQCMKIVRESHGERYSPQMTASKSNF